MKVDAMVECAGGKLLRIRCGNPLCKSRKFGPPLAKPHIICTMELAFGKAFVQCPRCGAANIVKNKAPAVESP